MIDLLLCLALPQAEVQDPAAELAKVCKGLSAVESYTFEQRTEQLSAEGFGGFGGGGGSEPPPALVGAYAKGKPVQLSQGEMHVWRGEDGTVTQNADGGWEFFDPRTAFGRRGGRGEGRGGRGGEGGEGRGGAGGEGRGGAGAEGRGGSPEGGRGGFGGGRSMRAAFTMTTVQLPHEMAGGIGSKVTDVAKEAIDGGYVFTGTLTPEAAQSYSGMSRRMGRGGRGGRGGSSSMSYAGTFQCTVDAAGAVQQIVVQSTMSGSFGEREIERTTKTTYALSKLGETALEVPEEVTTTLAKGPPAHLNEDEF